MRARWAAFAHSSGPGEVNVVAATTITGFVGLLTVALQIVLLTLHPPTDGIGSAGWVVAALALTLGAIASWGLVDRAMPLSVDQLVVAAVIGIAQVALVTGLTGAEPERQLMLLWIVLAAAITSRPAAFALLGTAYLAAVLPLLGDGADRRAAAQLLTDALLWAGVAVLAQLLFSRLRRERSVSQAERVALVALARHDELTGLGNRRALQEMLEEVQRAVSEGADPCTIAIFDLTEFKQINDRQGLAEGDRCLQNVGEALQQTLAPPARAFRLGGDEFVIVLPGRPLAAATPAVQRVQAALAECCRGADDRALGSRWGLAELGPGVALVDALAAADLELLEQKSRGREPSPEAESGASRLRSRLTGRARARASSDR